MPMIRCVWGGMRGSRSFALAVQLSNSDNVFFSSLFQMNLKGFTTHHLTKVGVTNSWLCLIRLRNCQDTLILE